jgi:CubicO group peptidase (beta-lactamase class C family)
MSPIMLRSDPRALISSSARLRWVLVCPAGYARLSHVTSSYAAARRTLQDAIAAGVFPAAAVDIGSGDGSMWAEPFGALTFETDAAATDIHTVFDLASLTKPIATTTAIMSLVRRGALRLDDPVASFFEDWHGPDRESVTIVDLLEHSSGLAARLVDPPGASRREFEHDICTMPLEYAPRTRSIYSDLGFILLGFIVHDRGESPEVASAGASVSLESVAAGLQVPGNTADPLTFTPTPDIAARAAPTMPMETDARRGRMLAGEVHDNYAAALGGIAGHAGLFGTAPAVAAFARAMLGAAGGGASETAALDPTAVRRFLAKSSVPGSSRALGWDTMLSTSSCGTRMSGSAFGHVGFTGTSLWIDPVRDRYFVLLTNRACGGGSLEQMREVRREFHDALGDV